MGVGSAILWAAQGTYLAELAEEEEMGFVSGLFYAIFMVNFIFGSVLSALYLANDHRNSSQQVLFIILMVIAAIGWSFLLFLPDPAHYRMEVRREKAAIRIAAIVAAVKSNSSSTLVNSAGVSRFLPRSTTQKPVPMRSGTTSSTRSFTTSQTIDTFFLLHQKAGMAGLIPLFVLSGMLQGKNEFFMMCTFASNLNLY